MEDVTFATKRNIDQTHNQAEFGGSLLVECNV